MIVRGTLVPRNGRAELDLGGGEVASLPARFAGRVVSIDVPDLLVAMNAASVVPGAGFEGHGRVTREFVEEDLDVLGKP